MTPDDVKVLAEVLEMLKSRGLLASRIKLPSGLEISFGVQSADLPERKEGLLEKGEFEKERRKRRDKILGVI